MSINHVKNWMFASIYCINPVRQPLPVLNICPVTLKCWSKRSLAAAASTKRQREGRGESLLFLSTPPSLINDQSVKKLYWSQPAPSAHFFSVAPSFASLNLPRRHLVPSFHSASSLSISAKLSLPAAFPLLLHFISSMLPFLSGSCFSPLLLLSPISVSYFEIPLMGEQSYKI